MKTVAKITAVEGGFIYGSDNDNGDAKIAFAPTLLEAIQGAIGFQSGTVDPTPEETVNLTAVSLRRSANGWAITLPRILGSEVLDVLPMGATEGQIAAAVYDAMSSSALKINMGAAHTALTEVLQ